jgi:hypothetical protein
MLSPPPLGAVSAGIRYQTRFFWRQALPMLYERPVVSRVVLEHRGVGAVDDVVVYYAPPGVNDRGALVSVDFYQLKFHVAMTGVVDHDALVDPSWTGTSLAMLRRFADEWQRILHIHPNARLTLVTNWPWNPASPLAPLIRDGGHLAQKFFTEGTRSKIGKIRACWQTACGLDDDKFANFVAHLRFSTSAVSQDEAADWLRDRCQLAGLVAASPAHEHSPYDDLGAKLIETGRTDHTPESLRDILKTEGLVAGNPLFLSTFAVRSFARFAHVPDTDGACVVDLTDLFDERAIRDPSAWSGVIKERLAAALTEVKELGQPIHVALDTHLSIAWHVGYLLDPKSGIVVVLRQRIKGKGVVLWDVSTPGRSDGAPEWCISTPSEFAGDELAVVISVTHSALADARSYIATALPAVGPVVHANLQELGPLAIRDGAHARSLADALIRMLSEIVATHRPKHVHVFPACPVSLAFLLGQEASALGPTTVYEFDFGDPSRSFQPGMSTAKEPRV